MDFLEDLRQKVIELSSQPCLIKQCSSVNNIFTILKNADIHNVLASEETKDALNKLSEILIQTARVKELASAQDRDYEEKDFMGVSDVAEKVLKCIKLLLPHICTDVKVLASVLMLCAEHSDRYLWSSEKSVTLCKDLVQCICEAFGFSSLSQFFKSSKISPDLLQLVLERLEPAIDKSSWKRNPTAVPIFKWFLLNVEYPHVSSLLPRVLPPPLRLIDDFRSDNKVLGVECIRHIITNVAPTELHMFGRADVIYDALLRLTFEREVVLIQAVYPCMLAFLHATKKDVNGPDRPLKAGRYDEVYNNLLVSMEHEQRLSLRRAYSAELPYYIDCMGVTVTRQLKRTLRVVCEYLITYESALEEARVNTLMSLKCLITVAWPRLSNHYEEILKALLRILYDVVMNPRNETPEEVNSKIMILIKECLMNLKSADPEKFLDLMSNTLELNVAVPVVSILQEILEEPS